MSHTSLLFSKFFVFDQRNNLLCKKIDLAKVTRVIENRLDQGMTLGMDSTVAYGNNVKSAEVTTAMT